MARLRLDPSTPVLAGAGTGFDASYAGISAVINPPSSPSFRVGYYHAEDHCPDGSGRTANAVGIAVSNDKGVTWTARQQLIGSPQPQTPCYGFSGVGQPSAVVNGGYV
jgi:hypothetical protein